MIWYVCLSLLGCSISWTTERFLWSHLLRKISPKIFDDLTTIKFDFHKKPPFSTFCTKKLIVSKKIRNKINQIYILYLVCVKSFYHGSVFYLIWLFLLIRVQSKVMHGLAKLLNEKSVWEILFLEKPNFWDLVLTIKFTFAYMELKKGGGKVRSY